MWELTKTFRFEAAHTLPGTTLGAGSEEVHGHSFRAEVTIRGVPDPQTGMVVDLGLVDRKLAEIKSMLDHKMLNRINALEQPTLENLARFVWDHARDCGPLARVTIYRDSCGEACSYTGADGRDGAA